MNQNRHVLCAAFVALTLMGAVGTAFAGGQSEAPPPSLSIPPQPRQFLSPENQDGVQDSLVLPFQDAVAPAPNMVIVEYNLSVYDADGFRVFSVSERQTARRTFFGNLFGGEKPRVQIPQSLGWDGRYAVPDGEPVPQGARNGEFVPDGDYTYLLTIVDDAGNFARSAPFNLTIDNTPPTVAEFAPLEYRIFSPNDDGVMDTITIPLGGSRELKWTIEVLDAADATVYTQVAENREPRRIERDVAPPAEFVWDGSVNVADYAAAVAGPDGTRRAPEGTYRVRLTGEDRAGNRTVETHPETFELSLSAAEVSIRVADDNPHFSPNGDGSRDVLPLAVRITDPAGLADWRLEVLRGEQPVRTLRGGRTLPSSFQFDGRRDDNTVLPDSTYHVLLHARFDNGNQVRSARVPIVIDTVAPTATVTVQTEPQATESGQPHVFGGAQKSSIAVEVTYDASVEWVAQLSIDETPVGGMLLSEFLAVAGGTTVQGPSGSQRYRFTWNGTLSATAARLLPGAPSVAPDGVYQIVLTAEDAAGNRGTSRPARVAKDTRTPGVGLTLDGRYLSPTSQGEFSRVFFRTQVEQSDGIEQFLFEVRNERGQMVRSSYQRQAFGTFEWLGLNNGGTIVPDGTYSGALTVIYQNGHRTSVDGIGPVIVDRTPPRIEQLLSEYRRFSPDGDGERDTVTIQQRVVPGDTWTARITALADNRVVLERRFEDAVRDFVWDGRGDNGQVVPDGDYRYTLSGVDRAGNRASADLLLTVDTVSAPVSQTPPEVRLTVRPSPFSPDGDGVDDRVTIGIAVEAENQVRAWSAEIKDPQGRTFRRYQGSGNPPATINWDGLSASGELVQSAMDYPITVNVIDVNGNEGSATANIAVDILVIREGDKLRIRIASIHFAPNTPNLFLGTEAELRRNLDTLRRLAAILNRYPEHRIVIEGHAAHVYLSSAARMEREQREELLPLSARRAEEVMRALIILGVERARMTPVGYGGSFPVVPHSDLENLWKNRRVEFLLERPSR